MPNELARLSANQLKLLPRDKTVFFFPVGPMEDHGPHLPLGLDVSEARALCDRAAARLESECPGWVAVVLPALPLGLDSETTDTVITVRAHVLRDWLVDSAQSLMRLGFLHFVCFSGQLGPRQLTAIEDAGKLILKRNGLRQLMKGWGFLRIPGRATPSFVSASSALVSGAQVRQSPFWPDSEEHGGARDTSVALALGAVLPEMPIESIVSAARPDGGFWRRAWRRRARGVTSYWGDPARADAARGASELDESIRQIFPKLRAVWEGADPNMLFRSWYSILPPNKSFFKAWILALLFMGIMLLWVYWNVKSLLS